MVAHGAETPELRRSPASFEVSVPVVLQHGPNGKAALANARILWNPEGAARSNLEMLQFRFLGAAAESAAGTGPQLWSSALSAAMAWQQTWRAAMFDVLEAPKDAGPETACAFAIGLMAAAGGVKYPTDLAIVAGLNPDNSLGSVDDLPACLQTAATAGKRRVIIALNQRVIATEDGRLLNATKLADDLNLKVDVAQDLMEAATIALGRRLPPEPRLDVEPRYRKEIFNALAAECEAEFNRLAEQSKGWPSESNLPTSEKPIWAQLRHNFEFGGDAFRAGKVYAARLLLAKAAADAKALSQWQERGTEPDIKAWDTAVNAIRKKIIDAMYRPGFDKGELVSALILAEQAEWLYAIDARMEGAQVLASQALGPRSDASPEQRQYARDSLFAAWRAGAYLVEKPMSFRTLYEALGPDGEFPVFDRPTLWLPQLMPAHLARAEGLADGLRRSANRFSGVLIFDPRFAAFSLMVRRAKEEWDNMRDKLEKIQRPDAGPSGLRRVGFRPGAAYQPPKAAIPNVPVEDLTDAARCMMWVNSYCETAILEQKYIRLGGQFDIPGQRWTLSNEPILQSLLQSADRAARYGIALARAIGVEADVLAMIYEHGTFLRYTKDDALRLEGLKQLWRCGLLGNLAWQFGATPKATVTVAQEPEPLAPAALPAIPIQGTGQPAAAMAQQPPAPPQELPPAQMEPPDAPPPIAPRAERVLVPSPDRPNTQTAIPIIVPQATITPGNAPRAERVTGPTAEPTVPDASLPRPVAPESATRDAVPTGPRPVAPNTMVVVPGPDGEPIAVPVIVQTNAPVALPEPGQIIITNAAPAEVVRPQQKPPRKVIKRRHYGR